MKKIYYRINFKQKSPLRIGNGRHEKSDSDLMLDGKGIPFIPGTSLAGIIRHDAERLKAKKEDMTRLFGDDKKDVRTKRDNSQNTPSALIVGDGVLYDVLDTHQDVSINRRDGVGLTDWGVTKPKAKFDFQIAEVKKEFVSILEWSGEDNRVVPEIESIVEPLLKQYENEGICVGARTTRGFGEFDIAISKKEFSFPEQLQEWLEFDSHDANSYTESLPKEALPAETKECTHIRIGFKFVSSFSIRVRTTRTELMEDGTCPDSIPMTNVDGNPVVPGTSWSGVFRHHMRSILRDLGTSEDDSEMRQLDKVFGIGEIPKKNSKSKITFSESVITGNKMTTLTRTAVERFTAAPRSGALYTSMLGYGGTGSLEIKIDRDTPSICSRIQDLLVASICDMHSGLLTIGGEVSVGRGLMRITELSIDGEDCVQKLNDAMSGNGDINWFKKAGETK